MNAPWRIEMLGGLRATDGDRVVTRFRTHKTGALLAYLAFYSARSHPREELIELLWPELDPDAGRVSLRVALSSLRRQLEPPGVPAGAVIIADRASAQLNPGACVTDVAEFEAALQAASGAGSGTERAQWLSQSVERYRGDLLPGYFEHWILQERQRLAEAFFQALADLIAHGEHAGDLRGALAWARRAVSADPLREEARRDLIRLLAACGQLEAALQEYQELERLLQQELGAAPERETRALASSLRSQLSAPGSGLRAPSPTSAPASHVAKRLVPALIRGPEPAPPRSGGLRSCLPPTGTVTFLLTDIKGSTALWARAGDVFAAALAAHHALLRRAFREHSGYEVKELGDGFLVAFARAGDALACAISGQRALAAHPWPEAIGALRVRMALHTGDAELDKGDYHGYSLHHAQRVLVAAHGGQILCSEGTAALLRSDLEPEVRLTDLGIYRLRDVPTPERLFQVDYPGMAQQVFPPPNAEPGYASHLPLQFTRFFGREDEIARLCDLLSGQPEPARLVTLTGPGGTGKTRLALEVAARLREALEGAIWFVPLQDLADPRMILERARDALRLPQSPEVTPLEQLATALSSQRALLLFDNFEHLVAEGAILVRALLERVPSITCLATSRQRLGLPGEREFPLLPLVTPRGSPSPEELLRCESVRLFVDRAQAVRPDFQVTPGNASAVAALCRRLEGIPLALELAAARAQVLTPAQMLERLSHQFELLTNRRAEKTSRHRSLWAAVEWSYQLLVPELQRFFAQLCVFRGGWTLAAAEAVCEEPAALDTLEQLRECSLIVAEMPAAAHPMPATSPEGDQQEVAPGDEMRFWMLETLREYAREQLEPEELAALEQRHAAYYLELAEEAEPRLKGAEQGEWLERLEIEHDNLRTALAWSQTPASWIGSGPHGAPSARTEGGESRDETSLRLASALSWFWFLRSYLSEGRRWLEVALAPGSESRPHSGGPERTAARAKALYGAGMLAWDHGDLEAARSLLEESAAIGRELGEKRTLAYPLGWLGMVRRALGDRTGARSTAEESVTLFRQVNDLWGLALSLTVLVFQQDNDAAARPLHEESMRLFRMLGDKWGLALSLHAPADVAFRQGDDRTLRSLYEEALALRREVGHKFSIAMTLGMLGNVVRRQGNYERAAALLEEGLAIQREIGNKWQIPSCLNSLAHIARDQGDYEAARARYEESLTHGRALGHKPRIAEALEGLAAVAEADGDRERAVRWFGAAAALREASGVPLPPNQQAEYDTRLAALRAALGEAALTAAWSAGHALTWEQAVAEALVDDRASG